MKNASSYDWAWTTKRANSQEGRSPEERAGSNDNVEVCWRNEGSKANELSYAQAEPYKCSGEDKANEQQQGQLGEQ